MQEEEIMLNKIKLEISCVHCLQSSQKEIYPIINGVTDIKSKNSIYLYYSEVYIKCKIPPQNKFPVKHSGTAGSSYLVLT